MKNSTIDLIRPVFQISSSLVSDIREEQINEQVRINDLLALTIALINLTRSGLKTTGWRFQVRLTIRANINSELV